MGNWLDPDKYSVSEKNTHWMCSSRSMMASQSLPLPGALNARDAAIVSGGRPESWALVSDTRSYASNRRQKPFSFYLESKYNSKIQASQFCTKVLTVTQ